MPSLADILRRGRRGRTADTNQSLSDIQPQRRGSRHSHIHSHEDVNIDIAGADDHHPDTFYVHKPNFIGDMDKYDERRLFVDALHRNCFLTCDPATRSHTLSPYEVSEEYPELQHIIKLGIPGANDHAHVTPGHTGNAIPAVSGAASPLSGQPIKPTDSPVHLKTISPTPIEMTGSGDMQLFDSCWQWGVELHTAPPRLKSNVDDATWNVFRMIVGPGLVKEAKEECRDSGYESSPEHGHATTSALFEPRLHESEGAQAIKACDIDLKIPMGRETISFLRTDRLEHKLDASLAKEQEATNLSEIVCIRIGDIVKAALEQSIDATTPNDRVHATSSRLMSPNIFHHTGFILVAGLNMPSHSASNKGPQKLNIDYGKVCGFYALKYPFHKNREVALFSLQSQKDNEMLEDDDVRQRSADLWLKKPIVPIALTNRAPQVLPFDRNNLIQLGIDD